MTLTQIPPVTRRTASVWHRIRVLALRMRNWWTWEIRGQYYTTHRDGIAVRRGLYGIPILSGTVPAPEDVRTQPVSIPRNQCDAGFRPWQTQHPRSGEICLAAHAPDDGETKFLTADPIEFLTWLEKNYPIIFREFRLELATYQQLDEN
jgi:hypothetical protein